MYTEKVCQERELKVYLGIPERGVDAETGLLLIIPGFGGNARSRVYQKMRDCFADKYNLVTIQCDYFGHEFMQASSNASLQVDSNVLKDILGDEYVTDIDEDNLDLNFLLSKVNGRNLRIVGKEKLNETIHNFNDMGIMQAIDNVAAVLATNYILEDNKYDFNRGKIIIYGHSHGAYLAYLCNFFAPELYSLIIDNSAWLYPAYLSGPRYLVNRIDNLEIIICFDYLASRLPHDQELLSLNKLYKHVNNKCHIISFHGSSDTLVSIWDKKNFCKGVNNCNLMEINPKKVDGQVFKSAGHGLDANFIKMFDYVFRNFNLEFPRKKSIETPNIIHKTNSWVYNIDYSNGLPVVWRAAINNQDCG